MPDDFEAEQDLRVLTESERIKRDTSRMGRAKRFAQRKSEEFDRLAKDLPGTKPKGFNSSVRDSKMRER